VEPYLVASVLEAVLAQAQLEQLGPLLSDCDAHDKAAADVTALTDQRSGLRFFFAERKSGLLEKQIGDLEQQKSAREQALKRLKAAVGELRTHFRFPTRQLAVIGDDLALDVRLGRMGGSQPVLVRSGTSGQIDLAGVPERRRPDAVVDGVADLLDEL